jgi:hypothetical protein
MHPVLREACDEAEILELETGAYAAADECEVSEASGSLPDPIADHRNTLVIVCRISEQVAHQHAFALVVAEQLERRALVKVPDFV